MKYNIIGTSKFGKKVIDTAPNKEIAKFMVKEYQMAFGKDFNIIYKKQNHDS